MVAPSSHPPWRVLEHKKAPTQADPQFPAPHHEGRTSQSGKKAQNNKVYKREHQASSRCLRKRLEPAQQPLQSRALSPVETTSTSRPLASSPKQTLEPEIRPSSASRKRRRESQDTSELPESRVHKHARPSDRTSQSSRDDNTPHATDPIAHWVSRGRWPRQYTEQDPNMERMLARKRPSSSLRSRERSEPGSASSLTPSDQRPREEKSTPYRDPRYKTLLETKGCFMNESELGITKEKYSLFRDDLFQKTCRGVEDRNETRVVHDITPLIVPSAEILSFHGATELGCLIESTNEGWNNCLPLTGIRPQPDYAVGFRRSAFTEDQLTKLSPFIGDFISGDQSYFMATYLIYFPFLACEVKCGAAALDVADRQNAHSMIVAVRATVELFRLVGREKELDRQILAFSVSHDHKLVRIHGYYPETRGKGHVRYYRHTIREFSFIDLDGRDRWASYRFIKNVYTTWMPSHFRRICSATDQLPSHIDFSVPLLSEAGLPQAVDDNQQPSTTRAQEVTPDTSLPEYGAAKRPRRVQS